MLEFGVDAFAICRSSSPLESERAASEVAATIGKCFEMMLMVSPYLVERVIA